MLISLIVLVYVLAQVLLSVLKLVVLKGVVALVLTILLKWVLVIVPLPVLTRNSTITSTNT